MLDPKAYLLLSRLAITKRQSVALFFRLIHDYDLTGYKSLPDPLLKRCYKLTTQELSCRMKPLFMYGLLEKGSQVRRGRMKATIKIANEILMSTESLTAYLIETQEREQRLKIAPVVPVPRKPRPPRTGKRTKVKVEKPYTPPAVSVFDKLAPFYKELV